MLTGKNVEKPSITRAHIGARLRALRTSRGWTQAALAARLGFSQPTLSLIERGELSLPTEAFLELTQLFNVGLDQFLEPPDPDVTLQNALVRLGALHLREIEMVAPGERYRRVEDAILDVLVSPTSARLLVALGPVLVRNALLLNLNPLHMQLGSLGLAHRLGWLLENVLEALQLDGPLKLRDRNVRRFVTLAQPYLELHRPPHLPDGGAVPGDVDPLDVDLGPASRQRVWAESSAISRRWRVLSSVAPRDFADAIEAANAQP